MRIAMAAAVLVLASAPAWAQGGQGGERQTEWYFNRMKERLNLTDEQMNKIKELSKEGREAEDKLQKEREEKVKEVLTEEQRKQYDEFRRNPGGRGQGGGGQGGGMQGWIERFLAPSADQLKKDLGLTDEVTAKVKTHIDEFNDGARQRFEEQRQNGFQGLDWQEEMRKFQDRTKELGDKIKQHLDDPQKEKLDKLMADRFNFGGMGGMFGRRGGQGGDGGGGRGERRPSVDDRVRRAMEALKIESAEDAAAVRDLVKKIVEAQYALEDYERESRTKVDELSKKTDAGEEEIRNKLDELRGGRKEKDKGVKDAQKALYEVVTYKQDLELVKQGILR